MFAWIILLILLAGFILAEFLSLKSFFGQIKQRRNQLQLDRDKLQQEFNKLRLDKNDYETKIVEYFFFYDLTRKLAPILNKTELINVFTEEMKYLGGIEGVEFADSCSTGNYLEYRLRETSHEALCIKTSSKKVTAYFPYLAKLMSLCVERINLYVRLQQLSIYDALTETYNRRHFMERFKEEFARAQKHNLNLVFLMIDIDHFKKVNDSYGHMVGDVVLRDVARQIMNNIREIDFLARFGGEEFALIIPDTDKEGAMVLAQRLCQLIALQRIHAFDETVAVTISIGAAIYPQNAGSMESLIESADKALYKAKAQGRNQATCL